MLYNPTGSFDDETNGYRDAVLERLQERDKPDLGPDKPERDLAKERRDYNIERERYEKAKFKADRAHDVQQAVEKSERNKQSRIEAKRDVLFGGFS